MPVPEVKWLDVEAPGLAGSTADAVPHLDETCAKSLAEGAPGLVMLGMGDLRLKSQLDPLYGWDQEGSSIEGAHVRDGTNLIVHPEGFDPQVGENGLPVTNLFTQQKDDDKPQYGGGFGMSWVTIIGPEGGKGSFDKPGTMLLGPKFGGEALVRHVRSFNFWAGAEQVSDHNRLRDSYFSGHYSLLIRNHYTGGDMKYENVNVQSAARAAFAIAPGGFLNTASLRACQLAPNPILFEKLDAPVASRSTDEDSPWFWRRDVVVATITDSSHEDLGQIVLAPAGTYFSVKWGAGNSGERSYVNGGPPKALFVGANINGLQMEGSGPLPPRKDVIPTVAMFAVLREGVERLRLGDMTATIDMGVSVGRRFIVSELGRGKVADNVVGHNGGDAQLWRSSGAFRPGDLVEFSSDLEVSRADGSRLDAGVAIEGAVKGQIAAIGTDNLRKGKPWMANLHPDNAKEFDRPGRYFEAAGDGTIRRTDVRGDARGVAFSAGLTSTGQALPQLPVRVGT